MVYFLGAVNAKQTLPVTDVKYLRFNLLLKSDQVELLFTGNKRDHFLIVHF